MVGGSPPWEESKEEGLKPALCKVWATAGASPGTACHQFETRYVQKLRVLLNVTI